MNNNIDYKFKVNYSQELHEQNLISPENILEGQKINKTASLLKPNMRLSGYNISLNISSITENKEEKSKDSVLINLGKNLGLEEDKKVLINENDINNVNIGGIEEKNNITTKNITNKIEEKPKEENNSKEEEKIIENEMKKKMEKEYNAKIENMKKEMENMMKEMENMQNKMEEEFKTKLINLKNMKEQDIKKTIEEYLNEMEESKKKKMNKDLNQIMEEEDKKEINKKKMNTTDMEKKTKEK